MRPLDGIGLTELPLDPQLATPLSRQEFSSYNADNLILMVFFVNKNVFKYFININWVHMYTLLSRATFIFRL